MLRLIEELLRRKWVFEMFTGHNGELNYHLHMYLGNTERRVYNEVEAQELLDEIQTYW